MVKPGACAVAHGLDVRALVGLQQRADRDPLAHGAVARVDGDGEQRLFVGAHPPAELLAQRGQRASGLEPQEKLHAAQRARRKNDSIRRQFATTARSEERAPPLQGVHAIAVRLGNHIDDLRIGV
jgi:hypothetical protein